MSRRARVTFNYESNENDELDLVVGQIIENITDEDEGWCQGTLDGKTGLFPNNFVEFIAASDEAPTLQSEFSKGLDSIAGKRAKVQFDYEELNDDELSLKVGDVVEVIREVEDGWWEGKLNGKCGVFPNNFVKLIREDEAPPLPAPKAEVPKFDPDEEDTSKRASIIVQTKMMGGGMGFGNLINVGVLSGTKLKKVEVKLPKKKPEPEGKPRPDLFSNDSIVSPLKKVIGGSSLKRKAPSVPLPAAEAVTTIPAPTKKLEKAKVTFDYTKQNEDELNLVVGDIVTVLDKDVDGTEGWWEGELNGRRGLFPDNFVELLPEEVEANDQREKYIPRQPPPTVISEKRAPPPLPKEESPSAAVEPNKKEMKKASDHEASRLLAPKQKPKPNDFTKPCLPIKKPVPPKPSTKPLFPSKKPVPKPPPESKRDIPLKPKREQDNLLKSHERTISTDESNEVLNSSEEYNLDVVTPHEPLKSLTTNRAGKQPLKRPPSTTRQSEGSLMDIITNEEIDEEEVEPKEPAWKREATKAREAREARKLKEDMEISIGDVTLRALAAHQHNPASYAPSPVTTVKEKKPPPPVLEKPEEITEIRKSWLIKDDTVPKKPEGASPEEVTSLHQEVTDLRRMLGNMEKKMAALERKHEEQMKSLEKDIEQLTNDFDEERTNHARLKIEVDRLKKKLRRRSSSMDGDNSHA